MVTCQECGTELREGAQFCDKCGFRVKSASANEHPGDIASRPRKWKLAGTDPEPDDRDSAEADKEELEYFRFKRLVRRATAFGLGVIMVIASVTIPPNHGTDGAVDYSTNLLFLLVGILGLSIGLVMHFMRDRFYV